MPEYNSIVSYNDIPGVFVVLVFLAIILNRAVPFFLKSKEKRQLFYIGLAIKSFGVIASFLFYIFIEKNADTQPFFSFGKSISTILSEYPLSESVKLFYTNFFDLPLQMKSFFHPFFDGHIYSDSPVIIRIAGLVLFLTFNSYLGCSLVFSFFGYLGCWLIFQALSNKYPKLTTYLFCFIVIYPPVFFWTSGIVKEPLCMGFLGILFFLFFGQIKGRTTLGVLFIAATISAALLYNIKSYLFIGFMIGIIVSFLFHAIRNIKNTKLRYSALTFLALLVLFSTIFFIRGLQNFLTSDNVLEIVDKIDMTTNYQLSSGSSNYDLGKIDLTGAGLSKYLLASINVALFRPYVFEINKVQLFLSGIDAFLMLLLTVWLLLKFPFVITVRILIKSPLLIFCLIFVLVIAAQIGAVSFNYGTLIRYKTPLTPFYFTLVGVLIYGRTGENTIT